MKMLIKFLQFVIGWNACWHSWGKWERMHDAETRRMSSYQVRYCKKCGLGRIKSMDPFWEL